MHDSRPEQTAIRVAVCVSALLLAAAAPAQVTFAVNGSNGSSGDLCPGTTCVPDPLVATSGFPIQVVTAGAVGQPHFLLVAFAPQCTPVPGFGGMLQLQPPGEVLLLSLQNGHFPHAPCATWIGMQSIPVPAGLGGLRVVLQLLAPAPWATPQWTFSNAVDLTFV